MHWSFFLRLDLCRAVRSVHSSGASLTLTLRVRRDSCLDTDITGIWGELTLSSKIKNSCLLSQISVCEKLTPSPWNVWIFAKSHRKTRKSAAARAFCTGALAAVQPRKWAPLELMLSNEKKHRHRHPSEPKKRWLQLSARARTELWASLHSLPCLLLRPRWSCEHDGRIHKRIYPVAFEWGMKSGIICFSYLNPKTHCQTITGNSNRLWGF